VKNNLDHDSHDFLITLMKFFKKSG